MAVSQSYGPTLINDLCFFVLAHFHTILRENLEIFGEKINANSNKIANSLKILKPQKIII
jgi:hypothetical protein